MRQALESEQRADEEARGAVGHGLVHRDLAGDTAKIAGEHPGGERGAETEAGDDHHGGEFAELAAAVDGDHDGGDGGRGMNEGAEKHAEQERGVGPALEEAGDVSELRRGGEGLESLLHHFEAEEEQADRHAAGDGRLPALEEAEGEDESGDADEEQDRDVEIGRGDEDEECGADVGAGEHGEGARDGEQAGGDHAGEDERDDRGALRNGAEDRADEPRHQRAVGKAAQDLAKSLAAHLAEIIGNAADAGEEEGESGQVQRKQFEHGRMHDSSGGPDS